VAQQLIHFIGPLGTDRGDVPHECCAKRHLHAVPASTVHYEAKLVTQLLCDTEELRSGNDATYARHTADRHQPKQATVPRKSEKRDELTWHNARAGIWSLQRHLVIGKIERLLLTIKLGQQGTSELSIQGHSGGMRRQRGIGGG
jgi:hypothetical protein